MGCSTSENTQAVDILAMPPDHYLVVAYKFIGAHEKSNRAEIKEFTGVDPVRTEWCAAFVNAVLNDSNIEGSESVSKYPLTARSFLSWGEKVEYPERGDIVVFPRGGVSWQGHVGFYLATVEIEGISYYWILGGNQNNSVSLELYRADNALGIRRPIHL